MKIKYKALLIIIIITIILPIIIPQPNLAWDGDDYYREKLEKIGITGSVNSNSNSTEIIAVKKAIEYINGEVEDSGSYTATIFDIFDNNKDFFDSLTKENNDAPQIDIFNENRSKELTERNFIINTAYYYLERCREVKGGHTYFLKLYIEYILDKDSDTDNVLSAAVNEAGKNIWGDAWNSSSNYWDVSGTPLDKNSEILIEADNSKLSNFINKVEENYSPTGSVKANNIRENLENVGFFQNDNTKHTEATTAGWKVEALKKAIKKLNGGKVNDSNSWRGINNIFIKNTDFFEALTETNKSTIDVFDNNRGTDKTEENLIKWTAYYLIETTEKGKIWFIKHYLEYSKGINSDSGDSWSTTVNSKGKEIWKDKWDTTSTYWTTYPSVWDKNEEIIKKATWEELKEFVTLSVTEYVEEDDVDKVQAEIEASEILGDLNANPFGEDSGLIKLRDIYKDSMSDGSAAKKIDAFCRAFGYSGAEIEAKTGEDYTYEENSEVGRINGMYREWKINWTNDKRLEIWSLCNICYGY